MYQRDSGSGILPSDTASQISMRSSWEWGLRLIRPVGEVEDFTPVADMFGDDPRHGRDAAVPWPGRAGSRVEVDSAEMLPVRSIKAFEGGRWRLRRRRGEGRPQSNGYANSIFFGLQSSDFAGLTKIREKRESQ
jgi:hypothetical protein